MRGALVLAVAGAAALASGRAEAFDPALACPSGTRLQSVGTQRDGREYCANAAGEPVGPVRMWFKDFRAEGDMSLPALKPDGRWTIWWPGGRRAGELEMRSGKPDGRVTAWHPDGRTFIECAFADGKATAPLVLFDTAGRRRIESPPDARGRQDDVQAWDETGRRAHPDREWFLKVFSQPTLDLFELITLFTGMGRAH